MKHAFKALLFAAVLAAGAMFTSACGTPFPLGCVYTDIMVPAALGNGDMEYNRMGSASCYSVMGWFAGGNSSLNMAAKAGDMNHVSWASQHIQNYCGVYGLFTTVVYGIGEKADPMVRSNADFE